MPSQTLPPPPLLLPLIEDVPERLAYQSPSMIEAALGKPVRIDQRGVRHYRGRAGEFQAASVRFSALGRVAVEFTFVLETPSPTPEEALGRIRVVVARGVPTVTSADLCQWVSSNGIGHKSSAVWEEALALCNGDDGWDRVQVRFP